MPVSLTSMREALLPGVNFMFHANTLLALDDVPREYPHLRAVFDLIPIRRVGNLHALPATIDGGYETKLVLEGREYPQGWGRLRGGAAAAGGKD